MIQEAYCSFEVAKLLKEKGFDENCDKYYSIKGGEVEELTLDELNYHRSQFIKAPTHQKAMAWLREEHNIIIVIEPHAYDYPNEKTSSYVFGIWEGDNYIEIYSYYNSELCGISYPTYEEAVETALKYSLKNLILL